MPRRGSYLNMSAEARAVSGLLAVRARGVKDRATLGYASSRSVWSRVDASCPAFFSSAMNPSNTGRTMFRRESAQARLFCSAAPCPVFAGGCALALRSAYAVSSERSFAMLSSVMRWSRQVAR